MENQIMKVQIKPVSNGYVSFKCVKYREGDVLEVDPQDFNSDVMVEVKEPEPIVEVVKAPRKRKVTVIESPPETIN
jgi:hypothetical protein